MFSPPTSTKIHPKLGGWCQAINFGHLEVGNDSQVKWRLWSPRLLLTIRPGKWSSRLGRIIREGRFFDGKNATTTPFSPRKPRSDAPFSLHSCLLSCFSVDLLLTFGAWKRYSIRTSSPNGSFMVMYHGIESGVVFFSFHFLLFPFTSIDYEKIISYYNASLLSNHGFSPCYHPAIPEISLKGVAIRHSNLPYYPPWQPTYPLEN